MVMDGWVQSGAVMRNGTAGSVDHVTCTRLRMMMHVNGIDEKAYTLVMGDTGIHESVHAAAILQSWM